MGIIDFATAYKSAITAGRVIEGTAVKQIVADSGAVIANGTELGVIGGNGSGATVYAMTTSVEGGTATTTGVGLLALDVGIVGAMLAPVLGVLAGVGLYKLAPQFWSNLSNALMTAGKTIGGKIIGYTDGDNVGLDEETIEVFKNQLLATDELNYGNIGEMPQGTFTNEALYHCGIISVDSYFDFHSSAPWPDRDWYCIFSNTVRYTSILYIGLDNYSLLHRIYASNEPFTVYSEYMEQFYEPYSAEYNGQTIYYYSISSSGYDMEYPIDQYINPRIEITDPNWVLQTDLIPLAYAMIYGHENGILQPNATPPTEDPFPLTYPDYIPWEYPSSVPTPSELPKIYPAKYPEIEPDPYPDQEGAQNPAPEEVPELYPRIMPDFDIPSPNPEPAPQPEPDPDVQPEPEPIPDSQPETQPDPADPNPDPPTPPTPIAPTTPTSVASGKLFTVYNPTEAQLNSLGGFLWNNSIMETIKKIWQDPLDGVISLIQVYATPSTNSTSNIILGYLDTGVSGVNVVNNQFTHIDCGSVQIKEEKKNATDYSPYTSLHLFLPFIGVVELDINEFMNGTMSVTYDVDVYTGTCLAKVQSTRTKDMPNATTIYTYSGNCSQQIPLTSGNATGVLSALVGGVTAGLSVATGGSLGVIAGASMVGHSLTHEMFHVAHGGNISANAGIMGDKIPYVILGRRHGYDANNYNVFYGFPANKTAYLNNHTGFVRCKVTKLQTSATDTEREEIKKLLEDGVYV